jgi:uncharacterized delta-60 repeat protein
MSAARPSHPLSLLIWGSVTLAACSRDSHSEISTPSRDAGASASDGGTSSPGALKPEILTLSRTGHDRFYGVTYGPSGAIYAVGQITNSADANADTSLLLAKFTAAGQRDPSFGGNGFVTRNVSPGKNGELFRGIVVQSSGKIVVAGSAEHLGLADARDRDIAVQRFNPDGTVDDTFGANGTLRIDLSIGVVNGTGFSADSAWGLLRYDDDRLLISGSMAREGGLDTDFVLLRLTPEGAPDTTFGTSGGFSLDTQLDGASNDASARNVTLLPNGAGLIGAGYQPLPGGGRAPVLYKVSDAGVLDTSFGNNGIFDPSVLAEQGEFDRAAVQPTADGGYKLVTIGSVRGPESETTQLVSLRLTSDGVLDPSYGSAGLVRFDLGGFDDDSPELSVLPDGRILLVGGARGSSSDGDGLAMILSADGAPDESFAAGGFRTFDLGGPADFFWGLALSKDASTAAIAGFKGVGRAPSSASDNDDAALLLLPLSQ